MKFTQFWLAQAPLGVETQLIGAPTITPRIRSDPIPAAQMSQVITACFLTFLSFTVRGPWDSSENPWGGDEFFVFIFSARKSPNVKKNTISKRCGWVTCWWRRRRVANLIWRPLKLGRLQQRKKQLVKVNNGCMQGYKFTVDVFFWWFLTDEVITHCTKYLDLFFCFGDFYRLYHGKSPSFTHHHLGEYFWNLLYRHLNGDLRVQISTMRQPFFLIQERMGTRIVVTS